MAVTTNKMDKKFEDYFCNKNYLKIRFGAVSLVNWRAVMVHNIHTHKQGKKFTLFLTKIVVGN